VHWEADSCEDVLTVDQILARLVSPRVHALSIAMDVHCQPESVRVATEDSLLAELAFATRAEPQKEKKSTRFRPDLLTREHFSLTHLATWLSRAPVLNPIPAIIQQVLAAPDREVERSGARFSTWPPTTTGTSPPSTSQT
jgi:hypothetical protein